MRLIKSHKVLAVLACLTLAVAAFAADAPTTKPAKEPKPKTIRLVKPWSDLKSLSDDQKTKISELHSKANADVNAIRVKEENDITALLSDEQKTELKAIDDKAKADAKTKKAETMGEESAAPKKD